MGRVGEYEVGKVIANGAFSTVKVAVHEPTGKTYVAKILPKTNRDVENDIRVEISILRRVRHENVVQLIEILESPRNYYIILEPVMGGDLCALIMKTQNGVEEPLAANLFLQLLNGVHACHKNGVAHRDLKPENLLLTPESLTLKISDFGLSRLHKVSKIQARDEEYANTLTGTLAYVAPEVLLGQYDAFKADIWSMGCILYVMLTCRFPFGSAQGRELEEKIKAGDVIAMPAHVSPEARDLTLKLLAINPKDRPNLEEIAAHPFVSPQLTASFSDRYNAPRIALGPGPVEEFGQVENDDAMSPVLKERAKVRRHYPAAE
jgi:serine/threonine protein kinase